MRDADDVVAEAEREQQLGGVGHEAHDAHPGIVDSRAMSTLPPDQIAARIAGGPGAWRATRSSATCKLADFAAAMALVNRVADAAEAANHHPDILVHGWNKLRLTLSTHSEGGVTEADLALAATIDALVARAER